MKALIIDDEVDICYLLSNILNQKNVHTEFATTLFDAQKMLKKENPAIVFLDNHLSDGLGVNFVKYIKENYPNAKTIMITAHDTSIDKNNALQEGIDYFLGKPFTKEKIYNIIDNLSA